MEKKKVKLFSAIALVALALLVVGVTYAYFQNQYGSASNADVNVTTYTTDVLTFATGDDINLEADQTTFGKDKGSVSGATYASALLTANNKTNKAVEHYYLYLNIENNTFTYSVQDGKPELIMTITDKDGNEVKNIEGLTYTEVTDRTNKKISGYDITTKSGLVTIFNNREIIAEPKAEDKWNITITFVNYEADQNANAGKVLSAKLMIQKDKIVKTVANICKNGQSLSSCIIAMNGFDETLYHHDASLVAGAGDNSYRYSGGDTVHPDYFSCKYKGVDVSNVDGELNKSLKGDCNEVSVIFIDYGLQFVNKAFDEVLATKITGQWDAVNNKCVTPSGETIVDPMDGDDIPEILCSRDAYYVNDQWVGLINVEELGPGVETLAQPADEENQKPALYSCTYNGNDVAGSEGDLSLKGECSTVYKISIEIPDLIDKTFKKNKLKVKWDAENNKCITSLGNEVFDPLRNEITEEKACKGEASKFNESWIIGLRVEELGSGVETLVEPAYDGVKNFVCFGSNESPCPTDNLYRIIGVFDHKISETKTEQRVKLIKYDYATSDLLGTDGAYRNSYKEIINNEVWYKGSNYENIASYYWNNATGKNTWGESDLNKINLNTNFLAKIGKEWADKIVETTWKVGGNTRDNIREVTPSVAYPNEILNPMSNTTDSKTEYKAKIGLMYVSDYGFAADPSAWTTKLGYYDAKAKNWMHMGLDEWTITRVANTSGLTFDVESAGSLSGNTSSSVVYSSDYAYNHHLSTTGVDSYNGVRPSFSLSSSTTYKLGQGTATDPIRIN